MTTPHRSEASAPALLSAARPGRVVRLHFECRAALPIGSFLRVTGSSLWAPGINASDPAEAAPAVGQTTEEGAFPVTEEASSTALCAARSLYTSSVELVTTPETYPVWRTRKPVIVVLNRHAVSKQRVQHHYYRYLVVSPGGTLDVDPANTVTVSTSSEFMGSTAVVQWEDPYGSLEEGATVVKHGVGSISAVSLASSVNLAAMTHSSTDYRNLPYRTLDIDVKSDRHVVVTQDHWNVEEDASFQPYLIREAVRTSF